MADIENVVAELRERTALRFIGDCKCGRCQLVPRELVDQAAALIESQSDELVEVKTEAQHAVMSMIFMPGVRAALDNLPEDDPVEPYLKRIRELEAAEARVTALEAKKAKLEEVLEWLAGEIEGERNLITHPHGRRAHHIDSQDEIRVEVLTGLLDRARQALSRSTEKNDD